MLQSYRWIVTVDEWLTQRLDVAQIKSFLLRSLPHTSSGIYSYM
jgi:hypothetical protein